MSFDECLKDAQRLGYAEANPSFDVDGHDTAQKLAILASLAFGTKVNGKRGACGRHFHDYAGRSATPPKTSAIASSCSAWRCAPQRGIEQRVHPTMIPRTSAIAQVMGVTNAVTIDGEGIPPVTLVGPGAGGAATASAVVADIADVARGVSVRPFGLPAGEAARRQPRRRWSTTKAATTSACWRATCRARAATIATRLAEQNISIESIVQRHRDNGNGEMVRASRAGRLHRCRSS